MITFVASSFSISVPPAWIRMATPDHLVVFAEVAPGGPGATITVSRHGLPALEAAGAAAADHRTRFASYRLIHESIQPRAVYRRFRWSQDDGAGVVQHQLFVDGLVVTCSSREEHGTHDEEFGAAIRSFRIRADEVIPAAPAG